MKKNADKSKCCDTGAGFKVEAVIAVDERGQMVLPKEVRIKAGIKPGDKLALVNWEMNGKVCCISLIKTEELAPMMKSLLGPMMKEMAGS
jgi:AbrB family looped-hinge helix DNA binding protein